MMLAVWSLVIPVLSMVLVGLPVRGLLARRKALDEAGWVQVPFLGVAITVLVLQSLLYLDLPINRGAWVLWVIVSALWAIWLGTGRIKESFSNLPAPLLAIGVVVLYVQSLGMLLLGPNDYVGRAWSDQFNYTVMAECFRFHGFSIESKDIGQEAWLARCVDLKYLRIGQSVLQAYHGVVTGMETRAQFMPTIFLSCPLITAAIFAAARGVGLERRPALLAGFIAGLLPGVSMLAQESFQSHALGIPFLLMLPTVLSVYNAERTLTALCAPVLCLGALASIYTEFLILELAMVVGFFVLALLHWPLRLTHLAGYVVLLAAPWLCNPLYEHMNEFLTTASLTVPGVLTFIYPWAYEPVSLAVVWFGDRCVERAGASGPLQPLAILLSQAAVAGGAAGLITLVIVALARWRPGASKEGMAQIDLRLALLGLAMIPAVMLLRDQDHPYQFFKLLVTVSPLYALGLVALAALCSPILAVYCRRWSVVRNLLTTVTWTVVFLGATSAALGTARMSLRATEMNRWFRTSQHIALSADFQGLRSQLEELKDQNILLRPAHRLRGFQQVWALYHARHNKIWLAWPFHNDGHQPNERGLPQLCELGGLPDSFLVVSPRKTTFLQPPKSLPAPRILWQNSMYELWYYDGRPWACITHVQNPNGDESHSGTKMWLGGGPSVIHLFANEPGWGTLVTAVGQGPCLDSSEKIRLLIKDGSGNATIWEADEGQLDLPVSLKRGNNVLEVHVLNTKKHSKGNDPRPLLVWLELGDLTFMPQSYATQVNGIVHED